MPSSTGTTRTFLPTGTSISLRLNWHPSSGHPTTTTRCRDTVAAGKGISCYQCCAYQFSAVADEDTQFEDKLFFRDGKHFSMGSWQVVSLNCPRAAYEAEGDDKRLYAELRALMDVCVEVFKIKRRWLEIIRANGRMPFAMQRPKDPATGERGAIAVDLDGLVYTIGVVGVNEMVQHHTGHQLHESREAWALAIRAMTEMELYAKELSYQEQHDDRACPDPCRDHRAAVRGRRSPLKGVSRLPPGR